MRHSVTALLLSLTITTASAALAIPAANAANGDDTGKIELFEATPKAPKADPVITRQIFVEPSRQKAETPEVAPVANLTQPEEAVQVTPEAATPELTEQAVHATEKADEKPAIDEDTFARPLPVG